MRSTKFTSGIRSYIGLVLGATIDADKNPLPRITTSVGVGSKLSSGAELFDELEDDVNRIRLMESKLEALDGLRGKGWPFALQGHRG